MRYEITESFSDYNHLITMPISPQAKKSAPYLGDTWQARLIQIPTPKGEIKGFITSCVGPEKYPLKALRSLKQEGIYQELWGILTSYNSVRLEMAEMAKAHKVEPLRISFINALYLIQDEFLWC
jgi:hypothetical protein